MTVAKVKIEPLKDLVGWYKLTFTSRKNGIGESKIELLISDESLRWLAKEIANAMPPASQEMSETIEKFMKED